MIRINPIPPTPAVLAGPESPAAKEKKAANDYWKKYGTMKGFKFKVYKTPEVVVALVGAFNGKCAYCEFRYDGGAPPEIEHYRPKGGVMVRGKLKEPGYYWLAAEWTNLLPSCVDCNRRRYHDFLEGGRQSRGKANEFPIEGKKRATRPGGEATERRLLLHPYFDEPNEYLRFVDDGAIQAVADEAGKPKKMAIESIRVYGLDRRNLSDARRDVWVRITGIVERLKEEILDANDHPDDPRAEARMRRAVADLKRELSERMTFLAMARQLAQPVADLGNP